MGREQITELLDRLEGTARQEQGIEFWFGRNLQDLFGYTGWRNLEEVLDKAKTAGGKAGQRVLDHVVDVNNMVSVGRDRR